MFYYIIIFVFLLCVHCVVAATGLNQVDVRLNGLGISKFVANYKLTSKPAFGHRAQPFPSDIDISLSSTTASYNFKLKVNPDVWAPGSVTITHANGRKESIIPPAVQYSAELKDTVVSATIYDDGVSLLLHNSTNGQSLEVRPKKHLIESLSEIEKNEFRQSETIIFTPTMNPSSCGSEDHHNFHFPNLKRRQTGKDSHHKRAGTPVDFDTHGVAPRFTNCYSQQATTYTARIGFHADYGTYSYLDPKLGSPYGTLAFIGSMIADANVVYSNQLNIVLRAHPTATKIMTYANGTPGQTNVTWNYSPSTGCWPDASTGLSTFTTYASALPWQPDVAAYAQLSRCSDSNGVAGVAYVGTACTSTYKTSVNQIFGTTGASSWLVFAHELGHNFGASHAFQEGQGITGGIMDYGDGRYPAGSGWYGFHPVYNKDEVCNKINNTIIAQPSCLVPLSQVPSTCGNGIIEEDEDCDPGPGQTSPCCSNTCKFTAGAVCDYKAAGGRGDCCTQSCTFQPPTVKCGFQSICMSGVCTESLCSYYSNTDFCSLDTCKYGCTVDGGTHCYKLTELNLSGGNVTDGTYCDVGKVCNGGLCVASITTTTIFAKTSTTTTTTLTTSKSTTTTTKPTSSTVTTTTSKSTSSSSSTTTPKLTSTTSKTTTIKSSTTSTTKSSTTITKSTTSASNISTTKSSTTTAKTSSTSTPLCASLSINSFDKQDTNLLGGITGTNGTGTYWIGGGIAGWSPSKNGYLFSNLFLPADPATSQCRSMAQYKSLLFLMARGDSTVSVSVSVGLQLGCATTVYKALGTVTVGGSSKSYQIPLSGVDLRSVKSIVLTWTGSVLPTFYLDNIALGC